MSRRPSPIDHDATVQQIASLLGVRGKVDLERAICGAAEDRVRTYMQRHDIVPETVEDVHGVVLNMTGVDLFHITDDRSLDDAMTSVGRVNRLWPAQLEREFATTTEAFVLRRDDSDLLGPRFTAFVDAREGRSQRAWFSSRHEPAHLLIKDPSANGIWRRTSMERPEPVERVVDAVASRIGFWADISLPVVRAAFTQGDLLEAFEIAHKIIAPTASFEASLRAFLDMIPEPLLAVRSDMAARKADLRALRLGTMFDLRAVVAIQNQAARAAGVNIWQNFRIPKSSVIFEAYHRLDRECTWTATERLGDWTESGGSRLRDVDVEVWTRGVWSILRVKG